MLTLTLPDGSRREVAAGTRPRQFAESIGKRLAQAAVAAKVNGEIVDLAPFCLFGGMQATLRRENFENTLDW